MKKVIMVSHGVFAPGLHLAVKMMTGERDAVLSTSLEDGKSTDDFIENFKAITAHITSEDEIILLADILSGSPFTSSLTVLDEKGMLANTLVIAGMNMPAALTAVLMKDNMDLASLKEVILSEGRQGLCDFATTQTNEDEDDI